jgi:hypothetical protein
LAATKNAFLDASGQKAYEGPMCTFNERRMDKPFTGQQFDKFKGSNTTFVDFMFPPNSNQLFWKEDLSASSAMEINALKSGIKAFESPRDLEIKPSLWGSKGVVPLNFSQGGVKDSWFLSAAAQIAEVPERLKNLFVNQDFTNSGIFELKLWNKGEKKLVNIDDKLAVDAQNNTYFAKQSSGNAWWLPLLEKAFARFNVNYLRLNGGWPSFALRQLTGMPVN